MVFLSYEYGTEYRYEYVRQRTWAVFLSIHILDTKESPGKV